MVATKKTFRQCEPNWSYSPARCAQAAKSTSSIRTMTTAQIHGYQEKQQERRGGGNANVTDTHPALGSLAIKNDADARASARNIHSESGNSVAERTADNADIAGNVKTGGRAKYWPGLRVCALRPPQAEAVCNPVHGRVCQKQGIQGKV